MFGVGGLPVNMFKVYTFIENMMFLHFKLVTLIERIQNEGIKCNTKEIEKNIKLFSGKENESFYEIRHLTETIYQKEFKEHFLELLEITNKEEQLEQMFKKLSMDDLLYELYSIKESNRNIVYTAIIIFYTLTLMNVRNYDSAFSDVCKKKMINYQHIDCINSLMNEHEQNLKINF